MNPEITDKQREEWFSKAAEITRVLFELAPLEPEDGPPIRAEFRCASNDQVGSFLLMRGPCVEADGSLSIFNSSSESAGGAEFLDGILVDLKARLDDRQRAAAH